jgi:starch synthase (maltosyl-transferring)
MFRIRAILASLLSPSWGIYAGYELFEHVARPGAEEYADNEKYQLRPRNWAAGHSLAPFIARLNAIRRANPALRWLRNLRFHDIDNDVAVLVEARPDSATRCWSCTFDSTWALGQHHRHAGVGFDWHERFTVRDELTGATHDWGQHNAVRLDPFVLPAHVFTVHPIDSDTEDP